MINNISIVSLSSGIIGEKFIKHEVDIGLQRLKKYGVNVKFMPNAIKGLDYIKAHPEKRAEDLIQAFKDSETDMILCAIGGDDTYRLLPYLFENNELADAVSKKIFLGFSDSTVNHFMMNKVGLPSFYGQAFLPDICEIDEEMMPYTKKYFEELLFTGKISKITPSDIWYEARSDFSVSQVGTHPVPHKNSGFELLQGESIFHGKILGGCLDTIFDFFDGSRYEDMPVLCEKYRLFPTADEWKGHILLLETSEEKMPPEKYRKALEYLKKHGVFNAVTGVIAGKPIDEMYATEYKQILINVISNPSLPVLFNLNIGHAMPRCIIPLGVNAFVDATKQEITFE